LEPYIGVAQLDIVKLGTLAEIKELAVEEGVVSNSSLDTIENQVLNNLGVV
jgi:hypothetical protein